VVITDFVEDGSDGMEKSAENSQAECSCRQGTQCIVAIVGIIACASRSTKTVETSVGSGQDCDGNESAYKKEVEDDEEPAEEFGSAALEAEVDNQGGDGVGSCSCKDAFDCASGVANILDHMIELVEARGEEAKGDD